MSMGMVNSYAGDYADGLDLQYNGESYKYKNRLITLQIDDEILQTGDMPAVLVNDTTMVPVRFAEDLGATMAWNNQTKTATYTVGT
jgi:hypothetical protein